MTKNQTVKAAKNEVIMIFTVVMAVICLVIGALALWANSYIKNMVKTELSAQKIYFPQKGTAALDQSKFPDLQKYAGQLVDTPEEAKAYANGYIGRHLHDVAGGKVYAEVSTEARMDPTNQKLQKQKETLFQGETLRGILLTSGYGFGTVGKIAGIAAYIAMITGASLFLLAFWLRRRA